MIRKLTGVLAACAFALATLAPTTADAQHRHRGYDRGDYGRHYRHRDHHDEVRAGVLGLVLGLSLGGIAARHAARRDCVEGRGCRLPAPPPPPGGCYDPCSTQPGAYDPRYDRRDDYDPRYDDQRYEDGYSEPLEGGYYEDDAYPPSREAQCTRRQWSDRERRFVTIEVPC
jgi:hypothetical protein